MNSVAEDLKDILEAESALNLELGVNLFIGREPSQPDNCVIIFDGIGAPPELTLENDVEVYYPSVQIRVRNFSYTTAYTTSYDIMRVLHGRYNEDWNGTKYLSIVCVVEPFLMDWDGNERARFVCNFNIMRRSL